MLLTPIKKITFKLLFIYIYIFYCNGNAIRDRLVKDVRTIIINELLLCILCKSNRLTMDIKLKITLICSSGDYIKCQY